MSENILQDHHIHCNDIKMLKSILKHEITNYNYTSGFITIANHNYLFNKNQLYEIKGIENYFGIKIITMLGIISHYKTNEISKEIELMLNIDFENQFHREFLEIVYTNNLFYTENILESLELTDDLYVRITPLLKRTRKALYLITIEDILEYIVGLNEKKNKYKEDELYKVFMNAISGIHRPKIDYNIVMQFFDKDTGVFLVNPDEDTKDILDNGNFTGVISNNRDYLTSVQNDRLKKFFGSGKNFCKFKCLASSN